MLEYTQLSIALKLTVLLEEHIAQQLQLRSASHRGREATLLLFAAWCRTEAGRGRWLSWFNSTDRRRLLSPWEAFLMRQRSHAPPPGGLESGWRYFQQGGLPSGVDVVQFERSVDPLVLEAVIRELPPELQKAARAVHAMPQLVARAAAVKEAEVVREVAKRMNDASRQFANRNKRFMTAREAQRCRLRIIARVRRQLERKADGGES